MGYCEALEAAGAAVHEYKEFGSYQGEWLAKVTHDGRQGWILAYFGSCSGCDAFQATFDCSSFWPESGDSEAETARKHAEYNAKLAEFAQGYLGDILSQDDVEKRLLEKSEYDGEAEDMLKYVRLNSWKAASPDGYGSF